MFTQQTYLKDLEQTLLWGEHLGRTCPLPLVIGLKGDLGAGKTSLCQGIGKGFGVEEILTSPTFTLVQTYASQRGHLYHLDIYRLKGLDDLLDLGLEEWLQQPDVLVLIEWFAHFTNWPFEVPLLEVELSHAPPGRQLRLSASDTLSSLCETLLP